MNFELLNNFGQNYPEDFDGTLDFIGVSTTCQFNRRGTLLAVGCNDGKVLIWDFLTRGISKALNCHVWPICSLSWSRNGHLLLTACADNTACVWDVMSGECLQRYRFSSALFKAQFAPRNSDLILVVPMKQVPLLINRKTQEEKYLRVEDEPDLNLMASFDRRGQYIFIGTSRGKVHVIETGTMKTIRSVRISGVSSTGAIKQIEFARRGSSLLINGADRIIRLFEVEDFIGSEEPEMLPRQKLQDLVNKTTWRKCCFSGDGEYVCASSAKQHNIYIWEKSNGTLVQILSGTKGETLLDVVWHPVRPIIASVANGVTSIWSQSQVENWSAFAPDFQELDENVEYKERESEFDDDDEDKTPERSISPAKDDEVVEVEKVETIPAFLSSDEEDEDPNQLLFIPAVPDIEDPEDCQPDDEVAELTSPDEDDSQSKGQRHHPQSKSHSEPEALNSFNIDFPSSVSEQHPLLQSWSPETARRQVPTDGDSNQRKSLPALRGKNKTLMGNETNTKKIKK